MDLYIQIVVVACLTGMTSPPGASVGGCLP